MPWACPSPVRTELNPGLQLFTLRPAFTLQLAEPNTGQGRPDSGTHSGTELLSPASSAGFLGQGWQMVQQQQQQQGSEHQAYQAKQIHMHISLDEAHNALPAGAIPL